MAKVFTLNKEERLKSRKAIEQLFKTGKRISFSFFVAYYRVLAEERKHPLKFGIGVSSKNFRKAIDRNRLKRLSREGYRLQKLALKEQLIQQKKSMDLFFIYTGRELPSFDEAHAAIGSILQKLVAVLDEKK